MFTIAYRSHSKKTGRDDTVVQASASVGNSTYTAERLPGHMLEPLVRSRAEAVSGIDMADVAVHYNSSKPAQMQAHAFTMNNQIHIAPGQSRHLPHEMWHAVQQKRGQVGPGTALASGVTINTEPELEAEADRMGRVLLSRGGAGGVANTSGTLESGKVKKKSPPGAVAQCRRIYVERDGGSYFIDTKYWSADELNKLVDDVTITQKSKDEVLKAISDKDTFKWPNGVERGSPKGVATEHLRRLRQTLAVVGVGDHWTYHIVGGGLSTLTGKRKNDGTIKDDLAPHVYKELLELVGKFYNDAITFGALPRDPLTLYRGIRVPHITATDDKDIAESIRRYADVIPSSASWSVETPKEMASPDDEFDSVILEMEIPPKFPIVALAYPPEADSTVDDKTVPALNQIQQEVLIGAYAFTEITRDKTKSTETSHYIRAKVAALPVKTVVDSIEQARPDLFPPPPPVIIGPQKNVPKSIIEGQFGPKKVNDEVIMDSITYKVLELGSWCYVLEPVPNPD